VAPSVAFNVLLTTAADPAADAELEEPADELDAAAVLACEEDPEPLELLPHAASVSDATSAGRRNFRVERIAAPLARWRIGHRRFIGPGTAIETPSSCIPFARPLGDRMIEDRGGDRSSAVSAVRHSAYL
jgi:hypothetical protein